MQITHNDNKKEGGFYLSENNSPVGKITYQWQGENIIAIDHTIVESEFRGKGIAGQLLDIAAEWARENNIKIIPVCSYVKTAFERGNAFDDVNAQKA